MSSVQKQLATFIAVLAVLFAGGALAGQLIDPDASGEDAPMSGHGAARSHEDKDTEMTSTTHGNAHAESNVRGLAVADGGLQVEVERPELRRGREQTIAFRIVGLGGEAVREFDVTHEKRMHLIIARRDLTGFQHLHPEMAADGTWRTKVRLTAAGSYRLFADFSHRGAARTLASDLRVDGRADLNALPGARPTAVSDGGYDVRVDSSGAKAGEESELRFAIMRDGRPVRTEPYLGAGGHLVALREGDLAFLHVHPIEDEHAAAGADEHAGEDGHHEPAPDSGDGVAFAATFPTAGRYRLFLQFQHEDRVQTVAFTQEVSR